MKNYFLLYHDEVKRGQEECPFITPMKTKVISSLCEVSKRDVSHWYQVNIQKKN